MSSESETPVVVEKPVEKTVETSSKKKETTIHGEVEKYLNIALDTVAPKIPPSIPPAVLENARKAVPYVGKGVFYFEKFILFCMKQYPVLLGYYEKLAPYNPELLFPSLCGLILCFFGGCFSSVISAVEALHNFGYNGVRDSVLLIAKDIQTAWDANKKDNELDEDNDGIADVDQVSSLQLVNRKFFLMLKVIDPNRIATTFAYLNTALMAILATLKVKFARSFTLAQGITEAILPSLELVLIPGIEAFVPVEYKKWVKPTFAFIVNMVIVSFAVTLQRIIDSIYSSIRGGLMFSRNIMEYLTIKGIYKIDHNETIIDEIFGYALALIGFYFQFRIGYQIPFFFRLFLFPLTFLENLLLVLVGTVPQ